MEEFYGLPEKVDKAIEEVHGSDLNQNSIIIHKKEASSEYK